MVRCSNTNIACLIPPRAGPGEEPKVFVGITEGRIVPARGPTTFGWDPVFEPEGFSEVRSGACVGVLGQGYCGQAEVWNRSQTTT